MSAIMHVMVDIETLSVAPNACILTLAVQQFHPLKDNDYDKLTHVYRRISVESQPDRHVDDNTLAWWAKQPELSKKEAFSESDRYPLLDVLNEIRPLIWQSEYVWIQGPTFDLSVLKNAYESYGIKEPWKYFLVRDSRTVFSLVPDLKKPPIEHHALHDCRRQISMLKNALEILGINTIN